MYLKANGQVSVYFTSTKWGHLFWKFGSHFFYINRVVLINLGRFYLCAFWLAVAIQDFLKGSLFVNCTWLFIILSWFFWKFSMKGGSSELPEPPLDPPLTCGLFNFAIHSKCTNAFPYSSWTFPSTKQWTKTSFGSPFQRNLN